VGPVISCLEFAVMVDLAQCRRRPAPGTLSWRRPLFSSLFSPGGLFPLCYSHFFALGCDIIVSLLRNHYEASKYALPHLFDSPFSPVYIFSMKYVVWLVLSDFDPCALPFSFFSAAEPHFFSFFIFFQYRHNLCALGVRSAPVDWS